MAAENHSEAVQRTPLFQEHKKLQAKFTNFGGWEMPVFYDSVLNEHKAVRENCGIFDVSHMGEIRVKGTDAIRFLQEITINDIEKLSIGGGQYTAMLTPSGGFVDDLIIYRLGIDEFFICANASNVPKDFAWVDEHSKKYQVKVTNESDQWSQMAIQGPKVYDVLRGIFSAEDLEKITSLPYTHILQISYHATPLYVARTGYTGEKGVEVYVQPAFAPEIWQKALATSSYTGIKPIGLGARDTLRLEACYLLYGNDMDERVTPLEAGINWATKLGTTVPFIGRQILEQQKKEGLKRQLYAFKMSEQGIPRHGMEIFLGPEKIGEVTSGGVLPTVGGAGGMALLSTGKVKSGDVIEVGIRDKRKQALIVKRPLYEAKVKN